MHPKFKPQFLRLVALDHLLQKGGKVNAGTILALPEYEDLHRKTVLRDIEYMRDQIGAPIAYHKNRKSYYYTDPNYSFSAVNLDEGELFAIMIAGKVLEQYRSTPLYQGLKDAYDKILGFLPKNVVMAPTSVPARYSFFFPPASRFLQDVWDAISKAMWEDRRVLLHYKVPRRSKALERRVDPYQLVNHGGAWYLIGHDHYKGEIRTFALSRAEKAEVLDEEFDMPDDFDLGEYMGAHFGIMWGKKEYRVRLCFAAELAPYVVEREWHPTQEFTERRDGSVELAFKVNDLVEVRRWVLSWGRGVEVKGPRELRDMVRDEAKALVRANS
jgi:predicted DNA-binding transcriptional regulator YafY